MDKTPLISVCRALVEVTTAAISLFKVVLRVPVACPTALMFAWRVLVEEATLAN